MAAVAFRLLFLLLVATAGHQRVATARDLDEDDWRVVMKGEWMIKFYAPWCPACRAMEETWIEFGKWERDLDLDGVAEVDVTKSPGLSGRFLITSLPTIFHVKDGEFSVYSGPRTKDGLMDHVQGALWKKDELLPSWKNPDSPQMTAVAWFFRMSMHLRNLHTLLTEEHRLPSWAVYTLFAAATVLVGALLGLILVLCIDCVLPFLLGRRQAAEEAAAAGRRPPPRTPLKGGTAKEKDSDDEGAVNEEAAGDGGAKAPPAGGGVRSRKPRRDDS